MPRHAREWKDGSFVSESPTTRREGRLTRIDEAMLVEAADRGADSGIPVQPRFGR